MHDGHLWTYPTVSVNTREHPLRSAQGASNGRSEDIAGLSDEIRRMAAKGAASTVLALAENLPKIVDLTDQIAE
jgi:hypothetical protein